MTSFIYFNQYLCSVLKYKQDNIINLLINISEISALIHTHPVNIPEASIFYRIDIDRLFT